MEHPEIVSHDELDALESRYARRMELIERRYRRAQVGIALAFVVFLVVSVSLNWWLFYADHVTVHICCDNWMLIATPTPEH